MKLSILVASFGDWTWAQLAADRAVPSASSQDAYEVVASHQEEGTVCTSRNAVAELSSGEWLCFLDADDELAPGFTAAMGEAIQEQANDKRLLLTPAVSPPVTSRRIRRVFMPEKPLSDSNWLVIGTLIRRDFFWEIGGFDEQDPHGLEDWSLWTRAAAAGATVVKVPDAVYIVHTRRLSSHAVYARNPEYGQEYQRIRRSAWPELYL